MACDCPEIITDPYENIDPCLNVILEPSTCADGENNLTIIDQIWKTLLLLRCQYIASGASAIEYRYSTNISGTPNNIVLPDAGILVGKDPENCFIRINGVTYLHISLGTGNRRYQFDTALDKVMFFDENNAPINLENGDFVDIVIFRA